jgi:SAM-dependent methyltransferase
MAQNIYDDPQFFQAYCRLPRSVHGLAGAPEWPLLRALLPDLTGLKVVDLGCGFGWFCRWARERGAAEVLGIDLSETMLGRARALTEDPGITYVRMDLERPDLPRARFDLAYSSLAFHYVVDLEGLLASLHGALAPGGRLVASMEHPIFTAPRTPGWLVGADGRRHWPLDSYLLEGPRVTDWLAPGVVKQHRTLGSILRMLIKAGFAITHVEDWGPSEAQLAARPELAEERDRPTFLLLAAVRAASSAPEAGWPG